MVGLAASLEGSRPQASSTRAVSHQEPQASFEEVAGRSGIDHVCHDPQRICGGVVFLDSDGDGNEDLFLTGGLAPARLYRNRGDGSFEDVTERAGLGFLRDAYTIGAAAGDLDNDGDPDLFVTTGERHADLLLRNDGGGFTDISERAGISRVPSWSSAATLGDFDLDGLLDIYVAGYATYDADPYDENVTGGIPNRLYRNRGDLTFEEVGADLGADDPGGATLAVAFTDYDGDGAPDLFVANDFGQIAAPIALLRNDRPSGRFENVAERAGVDARINAMSVTPGDLTGDGDLDYYITNIQKNLLYESRGNGSFRETAESREVEDEFATGWGAVFFDYDNDGRLDLAVANGRVLPRYNLQDPDHVQRFMRPHANRLYRGGPGGSLTDVAREAGVADTMRGRGLAVGDVDGDGRPDFVVAVLTTSLPTRARTLLFRNRTEGTGEWLKVRLRGTHNNRDGIGSRVEVWVGDRFGVREIDGGSSYASQSSRTAHFGLGSASRADSVVVRWPGGGRQVVRDVPARTLVRITEGGEHDLTGPRSRR